MPVDTGQLIVSFLVAGGLGALIGLERQIGPGIGDVSGGARTFALFAVWGAGSAFLGERFGSGVFLASLLGFGALLIVAYVSIASRTDDWGITTEAAAFVTFLIGALAFDEQYIAAVAVAVGTAAVLQSKDWMHAMADRFSHDDVVAALQFGVITSIVLPLIPDQTFGPFDAFNPRQIWLMVIFVSGIGLIGYLALRIMGRRGLGLSGLLGGLVSSTAVTLGFSRMSKESPDLTPALLAGVIGASGLMFPRVFTEAAVVAPTLIGELIVPLGILTLIVGSVAAYWFTRRSSEPTGAADSVVEAKNPLSLSTALQFGGLYAVIIFLSKALLERFSAESLLLVAGLSGINDVDAITLSTANLVTEGLDPTAAARAIMLAVVVNTAVKAGLAASVGSRQLRRAVMVALVPAALVGLGAVFLL